MEKPCKRLPEKSAILAEMPLITGFDKNFNEYTEMNPVRNDLLWFIVLFMVN